MRSASEERNAKFKERRSRTCKHFTGLLNDTCKVGVEYDSVKDKSGRPFRLPCLDECSTVCAKRELPTPQEVAAEEDDFRRRIDGVLTARAAIVEKIGPYVKGKSEGTSGQIPCPVCKKGELHYTRASYNGHIHAACSTDDCVRWME